MIIKNSQCQSHVRFEKWKLDWEQKANFVLWIIHKNIYIVFARNNHCRLLLVCCFLLTHSSPVRVCKYFLTYSDIYIYIIIITYIYVFGIYSSLFSFNCGMFEFEHYVLSFQTHNNNHVWMMRSRPSHQLNKSW